ncbi:hypothetical protein TSAR_002049, partial [Trichomalopsis sarcophagae]
MNSFVKDKLTEWGFSDIIIYFHRIDENKFERLTDIEIDSIIVEDDTRNLFKRYFNAYKKLQDKQLSKVTTKNDVVPFVDVTNEIQIATAESVLSTNSPKNVTVDNENVESLIYADLSNVTYQEKENGSTNVNVSQSKPAEVKKIVVSYTEALEKFKEVDQSYSQIQKNHSLYKLLRNDDNSCMGQIILFAYSQKEDIREFRTNLCQIIIAKEMKDSVNTSYPFIINTKRFEELSGDIVKLFPKENIKLYFEQGYYLNDKSSKAGTKRVNTSGLLYHEYQQQRDWKRRAGLITSLAQKASGKSEAARKEVFQQDLTILVQKPESIDSEKEKNIIKVWQGTYIHRHGRAYCDKKGASIIESFGVLQTDLAPILISEDFKQKFNHIDSLKSKEDVQLNDLLSNNWTKVADQIIKLARTLCNEKKLLKDTENQEFEIPNYSDITDICNKNLKINND